MSKPTRPLKPTVVLGKPPTSFPAEVTFTTLSGEQAALQCEFVYRTKTEFGELLNELGQAAKDTINAPESDDENQNIFDGAIRLQAQQLSKVLLSWDLPEPCDTDHLYALCNEYPSAFAAIVQTYRNAIVDGRLGN